MKQEFKKDYTEIIKNKLVFGLTPENINDMIIILNFCFLKKNDFFVDNFNKSQIKYIKIFYNQLKTNILSSEIQDILHDIDFGLFKPIRFILINYLFNYEKINKQEENKPLCLIISEDRLKNILSGINIIAKR